MAATEQGLNFINGAWVPAEGGTVFALENPARPSETVGYAAESSCRDMAAAIAAAKAAAPAWGFMPATARADFLYRAAQILQERAEEIAQLARAEVGKPITEARAETQRGVAILRYYAGEGWREIGSVIPSSSPQTLILFTRREPLGVVGVITPWNFPIAIPLWKIAPALVFGNTVVLKPAGRASVVSQAIVRVFADAGFPEGVLNLVTGSGPEIGRALVAHPDVTAITFTGSTAVGMEIARECARQNKKYQLEMGGKNAQIVLADANLDLAARAALVGAMGFAGQKCTACSRVIVEQPVVGEFVARLRELAPSFLPKDPADPSAIMGPVIGDARRHWVREKVQSALQAGARLLYGDQEAVPGEGYYLPPILLDNVQIDQEIAQEELFAPVMAVIAVPDMDEAIAAANSVPYGLSASIFTRNIDKAFHIARRLEVGMVRVNGETTGVEPQAPFGGEKLSSSHSREQGRAAMEFFTRTKTVTIQEAG